MMFSVGNFVYSERISSKTDETSTILREKRVHCHNFITIVHCEPPCDIENAVDTVKHVFFSIYCSYEGCLLLCCPQWRIFRTLPKLPTKNHPPKKFASHSLKELDKKVLRLPRILFYMCSLINRTSHAVYTDQQLQHIQLISQQTLFFYRIDSGFWICVVTFTEYNQIICSCMLCIHDAQCDMYR